MDNVERARDLPERHFPVEKHVQVQQEHLQLLDLPRAVINLAKKAGAAFDVGLRAARQPAKRLIWRE